MGEKISLGLVLVLLLSTLLPGFSVKATATSSVEIADTGIVSGNDVVVSENNVAVSGNDVTASETEEKNKQTVSDGNVMMQNDDPTIWQNDDARVEHYVTSVWDNQYQCEVTITNLSDATIEDWNIEFFIEDAITSIWNAQIISNEDGSYKIENVVWNKNILPGESVSFGFVATFEDELSVPLEYIISGSSNNVADLFLWESNDFTVQHKIVDKWNDGYQCELTISNIGENTIEDWNIMFQSDNIIERIWNADIISDEDGVYIIDNARWNADIPAGESVTLGYVASFEDEIIIPESFGISGTEKELVDTSYEVVYEVMSMCEDGYIGEVTIHNLSDKEFRNWKLLFDLDDNIVDIWNASIHSNEDGNYEIHYASYNSSIPANGSVTFGFRVEGNDFEMYPDNYAVKVVVHNSMRTDKVDEEIGVAYIEPMAPEDYRIESDGIKYVANQMNLVGEEGTTFQQIADLGDEYGFEIVGYIEFTNDYQIKFVNDKTYEELNALLIEFEDLDYILEANLNLVSYVETTSIEYPNDSAWKNLWGEEPGGLNWGVEAIHAPEAWQYADEMSVVKVGVHDNMFDENHEDLTFKKVWNSVPIETMLNYNEYYHGTHVAGIMAADYNNDKGIAGIAPKTELYAYACGLNEADEADAVSSKLTSMVMDYKYSFALMIGRGVRVINISYTTGRLEAVAATRGNENARRYIKENAKVLDNYLERLLVRGYDFVLVMAAGNANNDVFAFDDSYYGLREAKPGDEVIIGGVDARYNHFLNAAENVEDRVIVVGAYELTSGQYEMTRFSNVGERVDVVAPGKNIYSCMPKNNYYKKEGTSMAAPHVSGVAALVYSINPNLSGVRVKEIICETVQSTPIKGMESYRNVEYNVKVEEDKAVYYSVDALASVEEARKSTGNTPILGENTGFIMGNVTSAETGKPLAGVKICAYKYSSYDGNVGEGQVMDYQYTTETDHDGNYSLELDPGEYRVVVSYKDYLPLVNSLIQVLPNEVHYQESIMYLDTTGSGNFSICGKVTDALNGNIIAGATIKVRDGWNKKAGFAKWTTTETKANGTYVLELPKGYYTLEISKDGYITGYANVVCYEDSQSQSVVLSPRLADNEMRIVLTWGATPSDLDSHVSGNTSDGRGFHVFFGNRVYYSSDQKCVVNLDKDDTTAYGPETTTVLLGEGNVSNFKYYIHDFGGYSGSNRMSFSGARVTVYHGSKEPVVYHMPVNQTGIYWDVFEVTANGEIKSLNVIR